MKYISAFILTVFLVTLCSGQVQTPTAVDLVARAQITALQAIVNAQATAIAALQARPTFTLNGDTTYFLSGDGTFKRGVWMKNGTASFAGTSWRLAVYAPGVTAGWIADAWPLYAIDTPAIDFIVERSVKTDSLVFIRQANGTPNLTIQYLGISP